MSDNRSTIRVEVTGNWPRNGKSSVTAMIAAFLKDELTDVQVSVQTSESTQLVREFVERAQDSLLLDVKAARIVVIDSNAPYVDTPDGATNMFHVEAPDDRRL